LDRQARHNLPNTAEEKIQMALFDMLSAIFYTFLKKKRIFSFPGEFLLGEAALLMKIQPSMQREGNVVTFDHDFA
jgi:hypothetical protein